MSQSNHSPLFEKHRETLNAAIKAIFERNYYTPYPESPKAYPEDGDSNAKRWISATMNNDFAGLASTQQSWLGEEISPFLQTGIGVKYPVNGVDALLKNAQDAQAKWSHSSEEERAGLLIESLERISKRFFDIAYATMHTTGQSFMMSFQASGPHANDRALEAVAMGYHQIKLFPAEGDWVKPMGKFDLKIHKDWRIVPKGIGLVIGCSTFPVWNTVPGLYATLITGNACIVKPHAKAVLPIAIVIAELRQALKENGFPEDVVQIAIDSGAQPITKQLAEHPAVKMIDYTGNSEFGNYIESLPKISFTEKAGVNSLIIDSVTDLKAVLGNIAFSASLYSGQMCTAPQNIFIPEGGVKGPEGNISYADVLKGLSDAVAGLVNNPKAGPATLGAIQSEATYKRTNEAKKLGGHLVLDTANVKNEEFEHARTASPVIIEASGADQKIYEQECFGPVLFVVKTKDTNDSLARAKTLAESKGALTCGAYTTSEETKQRIADEMNSVFVPVSFNFTGAGFINSHAAFSDFHLTGANPAGNASFTNTEFVSKRFAVVGNRYM